MQISVRFSTQSINLYISLIIRSSQQCYSVGEGEGSLGTRCHHHSPSLPVVPRHPSTS